MGFILPVAAAGLAGAGAYKEASATNKALIANSEALKREAAMMEQASIEEEALLGQKTRALIGKQKAGFGAAGVDISGGTPLDIFTETEDFGRADAMTLRRNRLEKLKVYDTQVKGLAAQTKSPLFQAGKTFLTSLAGSKFGSSTPKKPVV